MLNVITNSQYKFPFPAKGYLHICKSISFGLLHYGGDWSERVRSYFGWWYFHHRRIHSIPPPPFGWDKGVRALHVEKASFCHLLSALSDYLVITVVEGIQYSGGVGDEKPLLWSKKSLWVVNSIQPLRAHSCQWKGLIISHQSALQKKSLESE